MIVGSASPPQRDNRLLGSLPPDERARLAASMDRVELSPREELCGAGRPILALYFPIAGLVSLIQTEEGQIPVEVGMVGNEGLVGLPVFLGTHHAPPNFHAVVQIPGVAWRVDVAVFAAEIARFGPLDTLLKRYLMARIVEMNTNTACARWHSLPRRLARWLLDIQDRTAAETFPLPQRILSQMLGVHRQQVSGVASAFRRDHLISYSRGRMTIMNRSELEALACTCYSSIRDAFALVSSHPPFD